MKRKIASLPECQKACKEYDSNIDYVRVFKSIIFWMQKKQGSNNKFRSKRGD